MSSVPVAALRRGLSRTTILLAATILAWVSEACVPRTVPPSTAAQATQTAAARPAPPAGAELATPVSHTTPHPAAMRSPLDGSYARLDSSWPQWWKCMRCADYRPAGGIWRLSFDRGTMRIDYAVTGWHSLASYTVQGDRLTLFNDPYCPDEVASYRWQVEDGRLRLKALQDSCSFGLRAENLESQAWNSCEGHASQPPGCAAEAHASVGFSSPPAGIHISIHGGHFRFMNPPPERIVDANAEEIPPPAGILISYSPGSIGYGLNRILWWEGNWIEVTAEMSVAAIGVQFQGAPQNGLARLRLDGEEVWRGNTADLGYALGQHGGYVEISGFPAGAHTLRVESLDVDYRPVAVAGFGFRPRP